MICLQFLLICQPKILLEYTQFDTEELRKCIALVAQKVSNPATRTSKMQLNAVKKKYENEKYLSVSSKLVDPDVSFVQFKGWRCPEDEEVLVVAKKKLPFGSTKEPITIPPNVQAVYSIIQKYTGSIGGNGSGGPIYGELTAGSMQKMINLMVEHTGFSKDSRFIDVGCGLAKPSLHVAQYPGVEFSYGIEVEHVRYMLGMSNLEQVLKAAMNEKSEKGSTTIGHKCILSHGDITEAKSFDPFTHVYIFDVG